MKLGVRIDCTGEFGTGPETAQRIEPLRLRQPTAAPVKIGGEKIQVVRRWPHHGRLLRSG
jgi:hypothetical protein